MVIIFFQAPAKTPAPKTAKASTSDDVSNLDPTMCSTKYMSALAKKKATKQVQFSPFITLCLGSFISLSCYKFRDNFTKEL